MNRLYSPRLYWSVLLILSGFSSFSQESVGVKLQSGDYILFWSCGGAARHRVFPIYCLTSNGLNVDSTHSECFHPKSLAELELSPKDNEAFKKALNIPLALPPEVLAKESATWGKRMTDAATTYMVVHLGEKTYKWQFKSDIDQCSKAVQDFVYQVWMSCK